MTAEAWVAVLAVACVGLLLIAGTAVLAWRRARAEVDEAICDREFVWGIAFDMEQQRDLARAERDLAQQLLEFTEADVDALESALRDAQTATRLALTAYGRARAIAEQSGMEYANVLDELGILRDSLDDARAELEDLA